MAFRILVVALAILNIARQTNSACLPNLKTLPAALAALEALPACLPCPPVQTKTIQKPDISIPLPLPSQIPLGNFCTCQKIEVAPALLPCAPAPPPPALAALAPALPALAALAPAPPALAALAPAPPTLAALAPLLGNLPLSPDLLKTLLGALPAPCPCA